MAAAPDQDTTNFRSSRRFQLIVQIVSIVAAIAGIIIPIFIYFGGTQNTLLTLRYITQQALVTLTPTNAAPITVTYGNVLVRYPWLLSGRIDNNGTTPIEQKDIVDPLSITFPHAQILNVAISEKRPAQIVTTQQISKRFNDADTVTFGFDLLNPDDYLTFSIILDGDPTGYTASFRMKGRFSLIQIPIAQRPDRPFITFPPLTSLWQSVALVFSSIGIVVAFVVSTFLTRESIKDIKEFRTAVIIARNNIQNIIFAENNKEDGSRKRKVYLESIPSPLNYEFTRAAYNDDINFSQFIELVKRRISTAKIRSRDVWEGIMGIIILGVAAGGCVVTLGGWVNFFS